MAKTKKPKLGQLAAALDFLSITHKIGEQGIYCMLHQGKATSFNMVVAAGTTIEEDLTACPQMQLMFEAVARCQDEYTITQLSATKLQVRSGAFQAYIPCAKPDTLIWPVPDAPATPIDDRLLEALIKVAPLLNVKAESVLEQSIQLNAGSCLSTNRVVILEAWHGFDLPSGLLLPKAIVSALKKAKKHLKQFGFSATTATFYFDDNTWMRTQLFQEKWPREVAGHLNRAYCLRPVPPLLFESYRQIAPFSLGEVYIKDDLISSHPFNSVEEGGKLRLPIGSSHAERSYNLDCLKYAQPHAIQWDETSRPDGTYFEGDNIRGMIGHRLPVELTDDEDIPF